MTLPAFTYSGVSYAAAPAGTTVFSLTTSGGKAIGYLQRSHIRVYTSTNNGATLVELARPAAWDFNQAGTAVVLASGIAAGTAVVLRRITPQEAPYVVFPGGPLLTSDQLNDAERASLYIDQEIQDQAANTYWEQQAQTITLQEQLTGAWASDDEHVATTAAVAERFDVLLQDTTPAAPAAGQQRQPGKLWVRRDGTNRLLSYWDSLSSAWESLTQTGPQGPAGPILDSLQFTPRSLLVNGEFRSRNRGLSNTAPGIAASGYIADQWCWSSSGSSGLVYHVGSGITSPHLVEGGPGLAVNLTLTSVAGAGNFVSMWQPGPLVNVVRGRTFVLSFWAKAATACSIATEFVMDYGNGRPVVYGIAAKKHSLTTSYQRFTAEVTVPIPPAGTTLSVGTNFLGVHFWFDAGSSFDARTNSLGNQPNNTINVTGVMLECGTVPGTFEAVSADIEALRLSAYYERANVHHRPPAMAAGQILSVSVPYRSVISRPFTPTATILTNSSVNLTNVAVVPSGTYAIVTGTAVATADTVLDVLYALESSIIR